MKGFILSAPLCMAISLFAQEKLPETAAFPTNAFLIPRNLPVIRREPDVPAWSTPLLEDHKGHRLLVPGTPEFFARGTKTFFGDVHVHSDFSKDGRPNNMPLPDKIRYARETVKLDFIGMADHIEHQTEADYQLYTQQVNAANAPGRFVTLPCYEWGGRGHAAQSGHRVVMFRDGFGPAFRGTATNVTDTPRRLNAELKKLGVPVMAPRHHPLYLNNWNNFDPDMEPVTEIFSGAGNSECQESGLARAFLGDRPVLPGNYVQDGLIRGNLTGFISGGDMHNGKPGDCGITAVIAPELTRGAIWDAIKARRCYATTGAKILLDFSVNGFPMGTVLRTPGDAWTNQYPILISCGVLGTANIESIEVIENNRVIHTHEMISGPMTQVGFQLQRPLERTPYWRFYYVRVKQRDGHMAWSSPVWLLFTEAEEAE